MVLEVVAAAALVLFAGADYADDEDFAAAVEEGNGHVVLSSCAAACRKGSALSGCYRRLTVVLFAQHHEKIIQQ